MEEAKESDRERDVFEISSEKGLSQNIGNTTPSPRANEKVSRTEFIRTVDSRKTANRSGDSFASLLSELKIAEGGASSPSKSQPTQRVNFQLPDSSMSTSQNSKSRISTSPGKFQRSGSKVNLSSPKNSPVQQQSIASVLKMYEQNRLRESQVLERSSK